MSRLHDKATARFSAAYDTLFALIDSYPEDKREQPSACGHWSPKQVLAHMCGWADEVRQHFDAFDAKTTRDVKYLDVDAVNDRFVSARAGLDWDSTVAELRRLTGGLAERAADSPRYYNWLSQLARDCEHHTQHLQDFAPKDAAEPKPAEAKTEETPQPAQPGYPILEYDATLPAIIEPAKILKPLEKMPERCVLCFFREVIDAVCGDSKGEVVSHLKGEMGKIPVYSLEVPVPDSEEKQRIAVTFPGIGAPFAAAVTEELIAWGVKTFVACGGAGVLQKDIAVGHVVVPNSAVRDEGTSYHYLPPGREVAPAPEVVAAIEATLKSGKVPYVTGKTWTTDGIYRETPDKVARRRDEGCITVEMEAATFFAVAQFRGVKFGQILYGGDDVSGTEWDSREWYKRTSTREKLFWLAVEALVRV
jgi:uridine phosphorylase